MKKLNIKILIISIVLILVQLIVMYFISQEKNHPEYDSAQSGIGVAILFLRTLIFNTVICIFMFLWYCYVIVKKNFKVKMNDVFILLLIIFTACSPFIFTFIVNL